MDEEREASTAEKNTGADNKHNREVIQRPTLVLCHETCGIDQGKPPKHSFLPCCYYELFVKGFDSPRGLSVHNMCFIVFYHRQTAVATIAPYVRYGPMFDKLFYPFPTHPKGCGEGNREEGTRVQLGKTADGD